MGGIFLILFFVIFLLVPLGVMLVNIELEDVKEILTSLGFFHVFINSIKVTFTATFISLGLGVILAWSLARTQIKGKGILMILLTLPMLIPSISHGMGLVILFGSKGVLSELFNFRFDLYGFNGIIIGSVLYTLPVAMLMIYDALIYEDKSLYEAGKTLGFSKLNEVRKISITYLKKPLIAVFFTVFTMIFTDYGVPLAVGGKYMVLSTYMYREVIGLLDFSKGAIIGIILLLPALITFLIDFFNQDNQDSGFAPQPIEPEKNKIRDWCSGIFSYTMSVLVCVPIITFAGLPFISKYPIDFSLTLNHIFETFQMGAREFFINSILISVFTAILGTAIAYISAYFTGRGKKSFSKQTLHLIGMVTVAVPGIVLGLGYIVTFNGTLIYGTLLILILVNIVHFFATPYLMAYNAFCKLNKNFEDVGKTLGINQFKLVKDVMIPSTWMTIIEMFTYYFVNGMITISAVSFLSISETKPLSLMIPVFEGQRLFECAAFVSIIILLTNIILKILIFSIKKHKRKSKKILNREMF